MLKWIAYVVLLSIIQPALSSAEIKNDIINGVAKNAASASFYQRVVKGEADKKEIFSADVSVTDTIVTKKTRKEEREEKNKIKELAKAKKQPKPEKIEITDKQGTVKPKQRPKRQRRPEGLERPPEIPRRNGN